MKMNSFGVWAASAMASVWLLTPSPADAATIVINASTSAQLYTAFEIADSRPSDTIEIRMAPGFYFLPKNTSPSDTSDTSNRTMGSLKLKYGRVKLFGASNRGDASSYVIDAGWTGGPSSTAGLFYVVGNTFEPSLEVHGVSLQNSYPSPSGRSPITVSKATFRIYNSNVVHTQMTGGGGGGLSAGGNSVVTIHRTQFNNAAILTPPNPCGGVMNSGGAISLGNVTAEIAYSTIMAGWACRGGGVYWEASNSVSSLTIRNSTITGNVAANRGGGLFVKGPGRLNLYFNTIYQNTAATQNDPLFLETRAGGGIFFWAYTGTLRMGGNISAKNTAVNPFQNGQPTPDGDDCFVESTFTTSRTVSGNILGERGNCTFIPTGTLVGTNAAPVDPRLGGKTEGTIWLGGSIIVHFPEPGSIALGSYQNGSIGCQVDDERGVFRASNFCTIGAVETTE